MLKIFAGKCMKMKEIGPRGGAHLWRSLGCDNDLMVRMEPLPFPVVHLFPTLNDLNFNTNWFTMIFYSQLVLTKCDKVSMSFVHFFIQKLTMLT